MAVQKSDSSKAVNEHLIAPFGSTAWDNVSYSVSASLKGNIIDDADWQALQNIFNQEVARRRNETSNYGTPATIGKIIDDTDYNTFATAMNSLNRYYSGNPGGAWAGICHEENADGGIWHCNKGGGAYVPSVPSVGVGQLITASQINKIRTELKNAGNSCFCNCNYCACNCNYCTCNCNYACTCNCNYSDERLKTNIQFI